MTQNANTPDAALARRLGRRRMVRAVLLSAVIFIAGGISGWGVAHVTHRSHHENGGMPADVPVDQIVRQMKEELLLTDDQSKQIGDIYTKRFAALRAIRQEMGPKLKQEYDALRTEVQKVLTPPQFTQWDQRFEAVRRHMLPPDRAGGSPREGGPGRLKGPRGPGMPGMPEGPGRPGGFGPDGPGGGPMEPNGARRGPPGARQPGAGPGPQDDPPPGAPE